LVFTQIMTSFIGKNTNNNSIYEMVDQYLLCY